MGVVKPSATAATAMKGLLRQGISSDAARQWLHQRPQAVADRNQLLAAIYECLEDCLRPPSLAGPGDRAARRQLQRLRHPLDRLQGSWDPDDGAIQPILALARSASLGMMASRRHPFLWTGAGQASGRWNRTGDQPVHYLASTPTVAWAEWIRHQEITDPGDLAGVAAALRAVLIPQAWGFKELDSVALPLDQVLDSSPEAQDARLGLVEQLKKQGAQGLLAPTAALHHSDKVLPAVDAQVILLWCEARVLPGWCCVPEGRPGGELLPLSRQARCRTRHSMC